MRRTELRKRGQAMVEFALVLPILLIILLGIMEFGLVFHEYLVVTHAAREVARAATLGEDITVVETRVGVLTSETVVVGTGVRGSPVTVTVTRMVPLMTPLFSAIFPHNPFPVTGTSTMRME